MVPLSFHTKVLISAKPTQGEGSAVAYLRAALVAHGALPERDETSAGFDRWLARTLAGLPDGPDRAVVTAFATWQVARRLAETTARHQGAPPESAVKHARTQVRQASDLHNGCTRRPSTWVICDRTCSMNG
ncbi:MAG: hypothetical protein JO168_00775 [Solirubrobacterales bacterium]|nr:hypothetical protein [Solirubrobacterales bacterium]